MSSDVDVSCVPLVAWVSEAVKYLSAFQPQHLYGIAFTQAVFLVAKYVFFFSDIRAMYTGHTWWWMSYISLDEVGLSE